MGTWSIGHWLIVLIIVLLLFGANKIPKLMGDMAKGVKAFKHGLKDEEEAPAAAQPVPPPAQPQSQARVTEAEAAKPAAQPDTAAKP